MPKAKDIQVLDNEIVIKDGDFVLDWSDEQHIEHIMVSDKGAWRQSGALGVGVYNELRGVRNSITDRQLEKKIRANLSFDGYRVDSVIFSQNLTVLIDAERLK